MSNLGVTAPSVQGRVAGRRHITRAYMGTEEIQAGVKHGSLASGSGALVVHALLLWLHQCIVNVQRNERERQPRCWKVRGCQVPR